jgi:hypothetical protein
MIVTLTIPFCNVDGAVHEVVPISVMFTIFNDAEVPAVIAR